ncbi:MAG: hypothetical protein Q7V11_06600, partial [Pseudotabrizicola sp.]|nr:hypothetical protein [Pseudotabrizicola sp.]
SLASRQQTERFAMLERAITPDYPVGSGGKKIAIAGLIASTGMGFFLAFLLDLINPVIRTAAQMERELNIRPIVSIPEVPHSNRKSFGSKTIKSLIESEAGRLPAMVGLRSLVILGGAALILLIALVSML